MNNNDELTRFFREADMDMRVNTAYPLEPNWFAKFRFGGDLFKDVVSASYYIHVPFCRTLCRYCEYTKFKSGDRAAESKYVGLLESQCRQFERNHTVPPRC